MHYCPSSPAWAGLDKPEFPGLELIVEVSIFFWSSATFELYWTKPSQVISGQHLPRSGGTEFDVDHDIVDPYVEVAWNQNC